MGKLKKDKVCIICKNKFRKLYNQKCWGCHVRNKTKMGSRRPMNLEESLSRVYTIRVYGKKGSVPKAIISVPPVLSGLKVKLVPIKK